MTHRLALTGQGMRRVSGVILALGLLAQVAQAQVTAPQFRWASRFGSTQNGENTRDMAVDAGGNTVVVGSSAPGSTFDFGSPTNLSVISVQAGDSYATKYDANGVPVWVVPLRGNNSSQRVTLDPAGNAYVLGNFRGTMSVGGFSLQSLAGSQDAFVLKLDPAGTPLWLQRFGGPLDEYATEFGGNFHGSSIGGIAVSSAGSLFFTFSFDGSMILNTGGGGTTVLASLGLQDTAVIKLDLLGNYLASTQFGSTNSDVPRDIVVDAAGDVVVMGVSNGDVSLGGTTLPNLGNGDGFFAKFTGGLQPVFLRGFGGVGADSAMGLATDPDRNIIVTGYFNADLFIGGTALVNQGGLDGFLAKFDPNGQLQWIRQIGGAGDQIGHKVAADAGGYIYLNGRYDSASVTIGAVTVANSTTVSAIYVVKLDPNGNAFWGQGATATGGFVGVSAGAGSILGFNSGVAYDQLGRFYISGRYEGAATFGNFMLPTGGGGDMFVASLFADFDILQHPQGLKVKQGDTATFNVVTSTNVPLLFQWLYNGATIPGANSPGYSLTNAQTTNSGLYSVRVSAPTGVLLSSNATLTVKLPPVVTQNPLSRTVTAGSTVTFSASATGDGPFNYQWFFGSQVITNANSPTLTLINVQMANEGLYALQVSNDVAAVMSANAGLFVNSPSVILASPTNQTVILGSNVTFTVSADGTPPLSYQWRRNGTPINGAVNQSLTITNAQSANAGTYDVVVMNPFTSVFSSNAVLTVLPPFTITPHPTNAAVTVGGSVTLTVGAVGIGAFNGPFTYQWMLNGAPLTSQTSPSLALSNLQLVNSGNYACEVGSSLGSIVSSNAALVVFNPFSVGSASFQPGGLFQMTAGGDNGRAYRLEASTNLVLWTPIVTNTVSGGTASFTDSTAAGNVLRFYRIVLLP